MNRALRWLGLCSLLWLALPQSPVSAQKGSARPMRASASSEGLRVSLSFTDMADKKLLAKLKSGLPQTITATVLVFAEGGKKPLTGAVRSCRVVYDLWEAKYRVHVQDNTRDSVQVDATVAQVVKRCFALKDYAIPGGAEVRGRTVYVAAVVEVNPMSRQTVKRIRRWLARPSGDSLAGDAFFGSFVSIFVGRDLGAAEKSQSFRSQSIRMP